MGAGGGWRGELTSAQAGPALPCREPEVARNLFRVARVGPSEELVQLGLFAEDAGVFCEHFERQRHEDPRGTRRNSRAEAENHQPTYMGWRVNA